MPCSDGRAWMRMAREDGFSAEVLTHEDGLTLEFLFPIRVSSFLRSTAYRMTSCFKNAPEEIRFTFSSTD